METVNKNIHLYFHSPCFDGAASAALASERFQRFDGYQEVFPHGVNYHLKDNWLAFRPERPCAVVDFLYHDAADFWADHHQTTFLSDAARENFERRANADLIYDRDASSCAILLWNKWGDRLGERRCHFQEIVNWADRIDSARYESVEEAISMPSAAQQINLVLGTTREVNFSTRLIDLFRRLTLSEIAMLPDIHNQFIAARGLQDEGLRRLEKFVRLTDDGIVLFDVDEAGVMVNRYAPFHFYPQARYSAGISRRNRGTKITTMRNPWINFPSAPLGKLCVPFGGGGHQRIGSIVLPANQVNQADEILNKLVESIVSWEGQNHQIAR